MLVVHKKYSLGLPTFTKTISCKKNNNNYKKMEGTGVREALLRNLGGQGKTQDISHANNK